MKNNQPTELIACKCYNENFSRTDPCLSCANNMHDEHCTPLKGDWKEEYNLQFQDYRDMDIFSDMKDFIESLLLQDRPCKCVYNKDILMGLCLRCKKMELEAMWRDRQRVIERLEKEKLPLLVEEPDNDWFYGLGNNHAIDKAIELLERV